MIPSKIKIESFAKRYHMGTLGGKGLMLFLVVSRQFCSALLHATCLATLIAITLA